MSQYKDSDVKGTREFYLKQNMSHYSNEGNDYVELNQRQMSIWKVDYAAGVVY